MSTLETRWRRPGRRARLLLVAAACAATALAVTVLASGGTASGSADLELTKTDTADPVTVGEQFQYTLEIDNNGPDTAEGVSLEDTLPSGLEVVSVSAPSGVSCTNGTSDVECEVGTIAASDDVAVILTVQATAPGPYTNSATVSAATPDPNPGNETDSEETTVAAGTGTIVIVEDAQPDDPQDFLFLASSLGGQFSLDDDPGDGTLPNQQTFTVPSGTYTVTQSPVLGWVLSGLDCVDPSGDTIGFTTNRQVNVALAAGETVTCTFTNEQVGTGTIVVAKDALPDDPQDFFFQASALGGGGFIPPGPFGLDDDPSDATRQGTQSFTVTAAMYAVTEAVTPGWTVIGIACADPDAGSGVNVSSRRAVIDLDAGETVTCTFTNQADQPQTGAIRIVEDAVPDDPQDFSFAGGLGAFSLDDDPGDATLPGQRTFTGLAPGTYAVSQDGVAGWPLTGLTCTDPDAGTGTDLGAGEATIDLDAGETVVCTFTNTREQPQLGAITVIEDAVPDDPQDFLFSGDIGMTLDDDPGDATRPAQETTNVSPGPTQLVQEEVDGWPLTGLTCDDPDGGTTTDVSVRQAVIDVDAGETVVCTFTNTRRATVTVAKDFADDAADEVSVSLSCSSGSVTVVDGGASESDPARFRVDGFVAGTTCTAGESPVPAGYVPDQTDCVGILLDGAEAGCTIVNTPEQPPAVAVLSVRKDFTDGSSKTVDVSLSCTSGSVTVLDGTASEADDADFEIAGFSAGATCTAKEPNVPFGYTKDETDCLAVPIAGDDEGECTLVNAPAKIVFRVFKQFADGNPASVWVTLACSSGKVVVLDGTASKYDPADFRVTGYTGSPQSVVCSASESPVPHGYAPDVSGCTNVPLAAAGCTIVNRKVVPPVTCNGKQATIVGGNGDSVVYGTQGDDVIVDLRGDNTVYGKGGNDTICTGSGDDRVYGGDGDDWIDAGSGRNRVYGEGGKDTLRTGAGNDALDGGASWDVCRPGGGYNRLERCEA